jgi:hypothetical protein
LEPTGKTEIIYSARLTDRELGIVERAVSLLEDFADAVRSEPGLEGGKSLLSTLNRAFDQIAFHHEASTRHVESSTRLNETYVELLRKQIENQQKIMEQQNILAKSIEEVKKAQAGQSSAVQSLDRRLKNIEGGAPKEEQKAPFRDGKSRPHHNRSPKAGSATPPAVSTTNEQPMKKEGTVVITRPAPRATNEVEQATNQDLQEQVSKLSVAAS